jgi:hypothetical protein
MLAHPESAIAETPKTASCNSVAGQGGDGREAQQAAAKQIGSLLKHATQTPAPEYFAKVQALADYRNDAKCVFQDGEPQLQSIVDGVDMLLDDGNDWDVTKAGLEKVHDRFPDSALVAIIEAQFWYDYAWNARGTGFADSISADGNALFHDRLLRAQKILAQSKTTATAYPIWYEIAVSVSYLVGDSPIERNRLFKEGAKRYPTYLPLYYRRANYLQPRWYGDWKKMDRFINWSTANTADKMGQSMYARLYWWVSSRMKDNESLFRDTKAKWPRMKQGFKDLVARYPDSQTLQANFAAFACQAGDRDEFLRQREHVTDATAIRMLSPTHSMEVCDEKYGFVGTNTPPPSLRQ